MERAPDDAVLRITAQFAAEYAAGQQPRLEVYAQRYPAYAHEIADFVTYFYTAEGDLQEDEVAEEALLACVR